MACINFGPLCNTKFLADLYCDVRLWSYELMHMADETLHCRRRERAAAAVPETPLVWGWGYCPPSPPSSAGYSSFPTAARARPPTNLFVCKLRRRTLARGQTRVGYYYCADERNAHGIRFATKAVVETRSNIHKMYRRWYGFMREVDLCYNGKLDGSQNNHRISLSLFYHSIYNQVIFSPTLLTIYTAEMYFTTVNKVRKEGYNTFLNVQHLHGDLEESGSPSRRDTIPVLITRSPTYE